MNKTEEIIIKELIDRNISKIGTHLGVLITEIGELREQLNIEKVMSAGHYQNYSDQKIRYKEKFDDQNATINQLETELKGLKNDYASVNKQSLELYHAIINMSCERTGMTPLYNPSHKDVLSAVENQIKDYNNLEQENARINARINALETELKAAEENLTEFTIKYDNFDPETLNDKNETCGRTIFTAHAKECKIVKCDKVDALKKQLDEKSDCDCGDVNYKEKYEKLEAENTALKEFIEKINETMGIDKKVGYTLARLDAIIEAGADYKDKLHQKELKDRRRKAWFEKDCNKCVHDKKCGYYPDECFRNFDKKEREQGR